MSIVNEEEEVAEKLSIEEVTVKLIAIGVNNCQGSYDQVTKELASSFFNLPLKNTAATWDHLNERSRLQLIDSHYALFKEWIDESSK